MEEIILVLFQVLFEFLGEVFSSSLLDLFDFDARSQASSKPTSPWLICFVCFLVGALLAWLSLLIFPHTWLHAPGLRIANLILAPLGSAALGYYLAQRRSLTHAEVRPKENAWQSFWFTLGLVAVRFTYAQ